MRIAALYDVHGNLPALEAVLTELGSVDHDLILVGGDVATGPMPTQTLGILRGLGGVRFIRGNADRELATGSATRPGDAWCVAQLSAEQRAFLGGLPQTLSLDVDGVGPALFCHATPRSDEEIVTVETDAARLLPVLEAVPERLVVCGHTHMHYDRRISDTRLVNAGSVGMPYGEPGAHWALLGPGVELRRTAYDAERAAALIRATGWPRADSFAAENVLTVPSAAEAVELFERMAAAQVDASPDPLSGGS
jgi:predicted phosphodiesterase